MPSFQVYLDSPFDEHEPTTDLGKKLQERIDEAHDNWTVYFNYTRTPQSNAPHYVGISVSGTTDKKVESQEVQSELELEVRAHVDAVDTDSQVHIEKVRWSFWY